MATITLIISALLLVSFVVIFILSKLYRKQKNNYEKEHNKLIGLESEYTRLVEAYQIRKNNKEEADEKIDNLHNGIITADDILPKR
jgi:uncharacterized membrane protein SpoIIM required for sporulation